jgi:polysaccharide pyruvyl transferase WcaK-like protein
MKDEKLIILIDPSLQDNNGVPSNNLGDLIIYDSVIKIIEELFPDYEVVRLSAHQWFTQKEKMQLKESLVTFAGGSNFLSSDIRHFYRFTPEKKRGFYLFPGFNNVVLLGTGWYRYQQRPDWATTIYFNRILNKRYFHSLRDNFSVQQLKKAFITKLLNTCCPTTWNLNPLFVNKFQVGYDNILFTLNNNYPNSTADNNFITEILNAGSKYIYFFPQVAEDKDYLTTLTGFKENKSKFKILPHQYNEFNQFTHNSQFNYIGTRLHAGIHSLQRSMPSIIIGVDNRAIEIQKDTNLNVIGRKDSQLLQNWMQGSYNPGEIQLPMENIAKWKNQFKKMV